MIGGTMWLALVGVGCLLLLWSLWPWVKQKFFPATGNTTTQTIDKVVDTTQDVAAKAALRAIRWMDEVDKNPQAVEAWNVLYNAVSGNVWTTSATAHGPSTTIGISEVKPAAQPTTTEQTGGVESVDFE